MSNVVYRVIVGTKALRVKVFKGLPGAAGASELSDLNDVTITNPQAGNSLAYNGTEWVNTPVAPGSGDVVGAASSVDNNLAAFDGTTGKIIKDSGVSPASFATAAQGSLADTAVQPAAIANFETTTQLNARDTANRNRANHTGTQGAATISDFQTTVSANTDVAANTAARHAAVTVTDSSEIDFTLTGQDITAAIVSGSIAATKLDAGVNASLTAANTAVQPAAIANFETTTQLNARDTANRDRVNHTGTQLANTISDFATTVRGVVLTGLTTASNVIIAATDTVLEAFGKLQAQFTALKGNVLEKDNVTSYTPSADFHPATKKYVDDNSVSGATALDDLTDVTITAPSNGQALRYNGTVWINDTLPTGTGDVAGPASAVNNNFAAFDGTTGKLIKDSGNSAGTFALSSHTHAVGDIVGVATQKLIGRRTTGTGSAEEIGIDGGLEISGNNIRRQALTGDVTAAAGDNATTIANDAVSNAKLANMGANTLKGNNTGSTADPIDLNATQVRTLLNVADGANNYTHPNHSGDVTSVGDGATTIVNDAVTNAKMANMAVNTIKGRISTGTGDPEDLTAANVRTITETETTTQLNTRDTNNRNTDNHTNGTTNKVFTATEQTKLTGIEAGAEVNTINSRVAGEPTGSDQVLNVVSLTEAEYTAGSKISTTFYIITDAV
jgi:hypothetical protein